MTTFLIKDKDYSPTAEVIENCIRQVSAEIYRISKMPYATTENKHKILYLDELLAAYERDLKKHV